MADKTTNKDVTIKGATDAELDALLLRLRKEREALSTVADIKRMSTPGTDAYGNSLVSYSAPNVSTEEPVNNLYHHGIPGMHWGIRRQNPSGGSGGGGTAPAKKTKAPNSEDHNKKTALKGKKISEMTNAELRTFNERLQLERQYKDLTSKDVSKGAQVAKAILTEVGKELAKAVIKKYAGQGLDLLIEQGKKMAGKAAANAAAKAVAGAIG